MKRYQLSIVPYVGSILTNELLCIATIGKALLLYICVLILHGDDYQARRLGGLVGSDEPPLK